jgi:hypothetical protein
LHLSTNVLCSNGLLPLDQEIFKAIETDAFAQNILTMLRAGKQHYHEISLSEYQEYNGHLLYQQWLYIPIEDTLQLQTLQSHHDLPASRHPRGAKTFNLIEK